MYVYISIIYIFTYVCFTFIKNLKATLATRYYGNLYYFHRFDSSNKSSVKKKNGTSKQKKKNKFKKN